MCGMERGQLAVVSDIEGHTLVFEWEIPHKLIHLNT